MALDVQRQIVITITGPEPLADHLAQRTMLALPYGESDAGRVRLRVETRKDWLDAEGKVIPPEAIVAAAMALKAGTVPCECGAADASWHGPEAGTRVYCCDACWARAYCPEARGCPGYVRPPLTLGGPCLTCGRPQPDHAKP